MTAPRSRSGYRTTLRFRLTAGVGALLLVSGGALVGGLYLYMNTVPGYVTHIEILDGSAGEPDPDDYYDPPNPEGTGGPYWAEEVPPEDIDCPDGSTACSDPNDIPFVGGQGTGASDGELFFDDPDQQLRTFLEIGSLSVLLLAALGTVAAWFLIGRILRPLRTVQASAAAAARGSFDHQLHLSGRRDEVSDLADTFDVMLGRLSRFVRDQRRVSAHASHELRGPLATMKILLDTAPPTLTTAEVRTLVEDLKRTNDRSIDVTEAILSLADLALTDPTPDHVELAQVIEDSVQDLADLASGRGISIHADLNDAIVIGDSLLLEQLVRNLIHNAVVHNTVDGSIDIRLGPADGTVELEVTNTGRVIDSLDSSGPFVRDPATPGSHGVGLMLSRSIVEAHDGVLTIVPRAEGGLNVIVRLPSASRRADEPAFHG